MKETIRYLICGIFTTIVSLSSFYSSTKIIGINTSFKLHIANLISFLCAVIFAYIVSKLWVFKDSKKLILSEFIQFVSLRIVTLLIDMMLMQIFVFYMNFGEINAKLFVQVIITILNYVFSKKIIFVKEKTNNENANTSDCRVDPLL